MSIVIASRPLPPPPDALDRLTFWDSLLDLGITRAMVLSEIDAAEAAGALTAIEAERLRLKITDASHYSRTDPLLLELARILGVAETQADIDAHFRAAAAG
jgi:hypothetical protein